MEAAAAGRLSGEGSSGRCGGCGCGGWRRCTGGRCGGCAPATPGPSASSSRAGRSWAPSTRPPASSAPAPRRSGRWPPSGSEIPTDLTVGGSAVKGFTYYRVGIMRQRHHLRSLYILLPSSQNKCLNFITILALVQIYAKLKTLIVGWREYYEGVLRA
uniref:Uncharacterized protein n=1 Tax=Triticum urartu TaxID=4572 RepID=A0A8R7R115_TRIUA